MRFRIAALMLFILATVLSVSAQRKTITNVDLEKYTQGLIRAEREYRENYVRLGLPSPEELERRREQSRVETTKLAQHLRAEELERERVDIQREQTYFQRGSLVSNPGSYDSRFGYYSYGFGFGGRGYINRGRNFGFEQPYYVSGGSIWPVGSRTPARPIIVRPRMPGR